MRTGITPREGKLVKVTTIPVTIIDRPHELPGLVRFPTESQDVRLDPTTCSTLRRQVFIAYRPLEVGQSAQRGRETEQFEVTIASGRYLNKKFKLEVPITRSQNRSTRTNELHFTFAFTLQQGTINLVNRFHDAQTEFKQREGALGFRQRLERQAARLDHRRGEEFEGERARRVELCDS